MPRCAPHLQASPTSASSGLPVPSAPGLTPAAKAHCPTSSAEDDQDPGAALGKDQQDRAHQWRLPPSGGRAGQHRPQPGWPPDTGPLAHSHLPRALFLVSLPLPSSFFFHLPNQPPLWRSCPGIYNNCEVIVDSMYGILIIKIQVRRNLSVFILPLLFPGYHV